MTRSPGTIRFHGKEPRGLEVVPHSRFYAGRFGRLFRTLNPLTHPPDDAFIELAGTMFGAPTSADNEDIPAGYTYLGQFIDHDITFDPISKLQRDNDPDALRNFRTPRFDLDSLYGAGPQDNPFMYQRDGVRLFVGKTTTFVATPNEDDCPRVTPPHPEGKTPETIRRSKVAVIGDPRNDENIIVNQLHLAFLKYHNAVVDELEGSTDLSGSELFDEACRVVRWHYQWLVIHDFLHRIVGRDLVNSIFSRETYAVFTASGSAEASLKKTDRKFFDWQDQPFIPLEFSVAAYRFGHSQIRPKYFLNSLIPEIPIFNMNGDDSELGDLHGFRERPERWELEWSRFFAFSGQEALQHSKRIDTDLSLGLDTLPTQVADGLASLAARNLLRGKALGIPSGQDVAMAMGMPDDLILKGDALGLNDELTQTFGDHTPLWYYLLKEAETHGAGKILGPVGGRIVAEVLIGLLEGDPLSYLNAVGDWRPEAGRFGTDSNGDFTMPDLLTFAGVRITA